MEIEKCHKEITAGDGNQLRYFIGSTRGRRREMEDRHVSQIGLWIGNEEWAVFGVFDGHSGRLSADHVSAHIAHAITSSPQFRKLTQIPHGNDRDARETTARVFGDIFQSMDSELRKLSAAANGEDESGSTAVLLLIGPETMYLCNLGDSRAVLGSRGSITAATEDHKPETQKEKELIERAGGSVYYGRLNGKLAVSRSFGDFFYKQQSRKGPFEQMVTAEPDVCVLRRKDHDEIAIIASDGVWAVIDNDELYQFVCYQLTVTKHIEEAVEKLIDLCISMGSDDNITALLVVFPGAPKFSKEARKREDQAELELEAVMKDIIKTQVTSATLDYKTLISLIEIKLDKKAVKMPGRSGGIQSRKPFIERLWRELSAKNLHRPSPNAATPCVNPTVNDIPIHQLDHTTYKHGRLKPNYNVPNVQWAKWFQNK